MIFVAVVNEIKKRNIESLIELCDLVENSEQSYSYDSFVKQWEVRKKGLYGEYTSLKQQLIY